ncbi:hypothetical protein C8A01DRAFT_48180 [Parachaetomium inaequale]|uniref:Uncharacterized protein n=1 Tax=Parachaetomium inaequale TaxID=2588326 RepID=A0AAN6PCP1_9PEZI|nr:hypothetical protein C8A01DRAFT_48180 [Parachaetomium inaequale]
MQPTTLNLTRETLLLQTYLTNRRLVSRFLLSGAFTDAVLSHLCTTLHAAPEMLLHVTLACASRFASRGFVPAALGGDLEGRHADAKAVKVLRGVEVQAREGRMGIREVVLVLTLGLGLVTFDLSDSGLWAHEVCRFTLGLVERGYYSSRGAIKGGIWVHQAGRVFEVDDALLPPLSMDVYNCLVRRQIPICRLEMGHDEGKRVDKYLGLCGPLLAMLFDICRLSHQLRPSGDPSQTLDAKARDEILGELDGIEDTVLEWDPQVPELFALAASPDEVRGVQGQARIYKIMTLLIIHRLRYAFGTQDDNAYELSQTILAEIEKVYARPSTPGGYVKNSTGQFDYRLSLPFFIAAIELEDPSERIRALDRLQSVVCRKIYPRVVEQLGQALKFVWEARDWQYCTHWFDLLSTGIVPFILL